MARIFATVVSDGLKLHDKPAGRVLDELSKNDRLEIIGRDDRPQNCWAQVKVRRTNQIGWVAEYDKANNHRYVKEDPQPERRPPAEPLPPFVEQDSRRSHLMKAVILAVVGVPILLVLAWCGVH